MCQYSRFHFTNCNHKGVSWVIPCDKINKVFELCPKRDDNFHKIDKPKCCGKQCCNGKLREAAQEIADIKAGRKDGNKRDIEQKRNEAEVKHKLCRKVKQRKANLAWDLENVPINGGGGGGMRRSEAMEEVGFSQKEDPQDEYSLGG